MSGWANICVFMSLSVCQSLSWLLAVGLVTTLASVLLTSDLTMHYTPSERERFLEIVQQWALKTVKRAYTSCTLLFQHLTLQTSRGRSLTLFCICNTGQSLSVWCIACLTAGHLLVTLRSCSLLPVGMDYMGTQLLMKAFAHQGVAMTGRRMNLPNVSCRDLGTSQCINI